jgi:putative Mg2+ transporter-C (MgtC) family protein
MIQLNDIIIKLLVTFLLSFIFGFERQWVHKPVGFSTYIFVALGSCGLSIVAIELFPNNPLPLLSAIVTGIGFLGAGALIKTADKIFGFTTAASIWVFAILGMIIGTGEYIIGITLYLILWIVILFDSYLEKKGIGSYRRKITITTNKSDSKEIREILSKGTKSTLMSTDADKKNEKYCFTYLVEGSKEEIDTNLKKLFERGWCDAIRVD